jgi:hypothetical protein
VLNLIKKVKRPKVEEKKEKENPTLAQSGSYSKLVK